jgi:hypothetical protein
MDQRGIALSLNVIQIDHLAPICKLFDVPLLVPTVEQQRVATDYYPGLKVVHQDFDVSTLVPTLMQYDVVFHSHLLPRDRVRGLFEKNTRIVHVPHGISKSFAMKHDAFEDVSLIYGPRVFDMFREEGVDGDLRDHVVVGNFRYRFFSKHREFFDAKVAEVLPELDPSCKTILYAPTWNDSENGSSFDLVIDLLIEKLPPKYNLIIKTHPITFYNAPERVNALREKCQKKGRISLLPDFPMVFPVLARADIFLGDLSSIGADFLGFHRPMFFLKPDAYRSRSKSREVFHCGTQVQQADFARIYDIIERTLPEDADRFAGARKEFWEYSFAPVEDDVVRTEVERVVAKEREDDDWEVPEQYLHDFDADDALVKYLPGIDRSVKI